MPIDVRFSVNEDLVRKYEFRTERGSSIVRVVVPGELDLTFAQDVYKNSSLPSSAVRSSNAARFASRLSDLFAEQEIVTQVVIP